MLLTIGYEGVTVAEFVNTLLNNKVECLVDVRDRAQSRRKGFSKSALSATLIENEIDYIHLKDLGDPKPGRDAARAGQYNLFVEIYSQVLESPRAIFAMNHIEALSNAKSTCLMCYERDHTACHRSLICTDLFLRSGIQISHL